MTYFVSLKYTAIIIGLIYLVAHLPVALAPGRFAGMMRAFPRNYPAGIVLMLLATVWFTTLTGVMDLGEISNLRMKLMLAWSAAGILLTIFVPGFLAPRGLGCLLLLAAAVMLDAQFLALTPWRFAITVLAYVWVIFGMVLVYSPHLMRDWIAYITANAGRMRAFAWPGAVYGLLLVVLGIFVYP